MIDVLVIGAGPAGSFAATLLARAGLAVTLVEQFAFPRDKVCGECLSATGIEVLERAELMSAKTFVTSPAHDTPCCPLIDHARIYAARSNAPLVFPFDAPMIGASRALLDQTLLDAARAAGVIVRQPARVESVTPDTAAPSAVVRDGATSDRETIAARLIVVADGKAATGLRRPAPTDDLGIKTHFVNVAADPTAVTLFGFDGCYGGVAPIENGRWNVALSVPAATVKRHAGDLAAVFAGLLQSNTAASSAFAQATRVAPWLATPLPRFKPAAMDWRAGVVPVGNAAAALEPIGGEGMGLALRSAELAATAVISALGKNNFLNIGSLRRDYDELWRVRSLACRSAARLLSSKTWAGAGIELLSHTPGFLRALAGLMGKSRI